MKKALYILIFVCSQTIVAQTYFTRTGFTEFKASVEAFEPVEAKNKSTTVILKTATGDIAAQLFINAFQFRVALMQEHFNENYMDSDKYPKAIFRGKILDFDQKSIDENKSYTLTGSLTIRGVKKDVTTTTRIKSDNGKIHLTAAFTVKPEDFGIKIPSIVSNKIAEKINISLDYELIEKK
jgi:polyisoprenoid-binding protein YceI